MSVDTMFDPYHLVLYEYDWINIRLIYSTFNAEISFYSILWFYDERGAVIKVEKMCRVKTNFVKLVIYVYVYVVKVYSFERTKSNQRVLLEIWHSAALSLQLVWFPIYSCGFFWFSVLHLFNSLNET